MPFYVVPVTSVYHCHTVGLLLHFDSILLADYYFIDPQWLCDVLAVIVSPLKQINKFGMCVKCQKCILLLRMLHFLSCTKRKCDD